MRLYLTILFTIFSLSSFSQSQLDMNMDAGDQLEMANKELNSVYADILVEYHSDTVFIEALKSSQEVWKKYRDAELTLKYPHKGRGHYGSVKPMCEAFYLAALTIERIETLKVWLDGIEEGDVCKGSVKLK